MGRIKDGKSKEACAQNTQAWRYMSGGWCLAGHRRIGKTSIPNLARSSLVGGGSLRAFRWGELRIECQIAIKSIDCYILWSGGKLTSRKCPALEPKLFKIKVKARFERFSEGLDVVWYRSKIDKSIGTFMDLFSHGFGRNLKPHVAKLELESRQK